MSGTVVPWSADPNALAVLQPRRQRSRLTVIAMIGLGLALLLVGVLLLLVGDPLPLLVSTVAAAVSFPLLIWFFFWLDRWEPEPTRYRWAALVWGGSAAVLIGAGAQFVLAAFTRSEFWLAVVIAPSTEEFAKGLFLVLVVWLRELTRAESWTASSTPGWPGSASPSPRTSCTTPAPSPMVARRTSPRLVIVRGSSARSRTRCSPPPSASASAWR